MPCGGVSAGICRELWKKCDYEGFLGMALKRDMAVANRYVDWEE